MPAAGCSSGGAQRHCAAAYYVARKPRGTAGAESEWDEHDEYHDDDDTGYRIREMFEAKLLAELQRKMAGKVEPDPAIVVAQSAVTELVADQDRSVALAARDGTASEDSVEAKDASSKLERLQRVRGVVAEQVKVRTKWCQLLQPHREMLNQAIGSLEKASGGSLRLAESLEAQEAQPDRHRSEIEAIKLEMPSLEVQKKLAVSSRGFKEAGRISEQMRAREEERRALEEQFEELQSSLLTSCEVLVANRQDEEAAQAELLRIETDCAMEGVDVVALRKRVGDATGERALLEMEERNLRTAQVHLAAKHGLMLAPRTSRSQSRRSAMCPAKPLSWRLRLKPSWTRPVVTARR